MLPKLVFYLSASPNLQHLLFRCPAGPIQAVDVKRPNRGPYYAFLEFKSQQDAEIAIREVNNSDFAGKRLVVEQSKGGKVSASSRGPPRRYVLLCSFEFSLFLLLSAHILYILFIRSWSYFSFSMDSLIAFRLPSQL